MSRYAQVVVEEARDFTAQLLQPLKPIVHAITGALGLNRASATTH
ncbi:hypothetical protein [Paraburkholderia sp. J8-2]|nr:hypothetical protein [Paraburkholderia sp. J8-2]